MENETVVYTRHEIRTSLNHIRGYSEIILDDAVDMNRDFIADMAREILGEIDVLSPLVGQLFPSLEGALANRKTIEKAFYKSCYQVIEIIHDLKKKSDFKGTAYYQSDIYKMLYAANRIIDLVDDLLGNAQLSLMAPDEIQEAPIEEKRLDVGDLGGNPVRGGVILVVDDNPMNRDILCRHLERQGHEVHSAAEGGEAIDLLERIPFDLIILDIMMPGMNGYEFLRRLKGTPDHLHLPVIVISALDEMESVIRCIELGAEDYLPKTFDPVLLKARINASLEKKRLRDHEKTYVKALIDSHRSLISEFDEAARYVKTLLPPKGPTKSVRADWVFVPSAQLGGDCFGYHWIDENRMAFYLLDVSGHGIGAALLSVTLLNVLKTQSLPKTDFGEPAEVLAVLNRAFPMENQNNMYFSLWYGVYDAKNRKLRYASGGAPPALLFSRSVPDGNESYRRLLTEGMIIGVDLDFKYEDETCVIEPGQKLYLFSDGCFEVRKMSGDLLSMTDFLRILALHAQEDGKPLSSVLHQIQGIAGTNILDDDFSMMTLSF